MPDLRHPEDGLRRFRRSIAAPRGSVGYYKEHPAGPQVLFRYKTLCFRSFLPVIPNGTGDFQPKESCPAGTIRPGAPPGLWRQTRRKSRSRTRTPVLSPTPAFGMTKRRCPHLFLPLFFSVFQCYNLSVYPLPGKNAESASGRRGSIQRAAPPGCPRRKRSAIF